MTLYLNDERLSPCPAPLRMGKGWEEKQLTSTEASPPDESECIIPGIGESGKIKQRISFRVCIEMESNAALMSMNTRAAFG